MEIFLTKHDRQANKNGLWSASVLSQLWRYAAYEARSVIAGPALTIEKPRDGEVFSEPLIIIAGRANIPRNFHKRPTNLY